ncbi:ABC transporter ATP-binding protein [Mycolicibacterium sp. P9-22]|uniref:ABC transporter ATP-binding protein n=1 Tax=Mycolicibacterium sp. P9-22 TaxID=2024613 RepID=UPI0011EBA957|nr:ABC transporter ATP-binding protein [Mycolicibacterium sp. P9-22]KAA0109042.1 ABC transporter ATP-binding protein [Mycolicibacterium sp. P9-22]
MTVTLRCNDLQKRYPGQHDRALGADGHAISFDVERSELFALLGPSGCGKTTILRIIGGFVDPDAGSVFIDGQDVTRLAPYRRPTNTVFQSYALFPHLKLGANVAFGLQMSRVSKAEQDRRVAEALALVGLPNWQQRRVNELSGGQQQRAALARALVNRPSVVLLDEPLGALDLKLRRQMQDELAQLKREADTTFVHVTHDQEEACAIADRIAIMDKGRIVQIDSPLELYRNPRTSYVARFIDVGTVIRGDVRRSADICELSSPAITLRGRAPAWSTDGVPLAAVLPHNRVRVDPGHGEASASSVHAVVQRITFTGTAFDLLVRTAAGLELRAGTNDNRFASVAQGDDVTVSWHPEDLLFVEDSDYGEQAESDAPAA